MPHKSNFFSFFFVFAMSQFDLPMVKKKSWIYGGYPNIEDTTEKKKITPLFNWPTIWVRRGGHWAKHMGLKGSAIGNTLGNTLNLIGTHWELGDKGKMKKFLPSPTPTPTPPQNLKEKKSGHFECMLSLPIGCMKFLCSKTVQFHFWVWANKTPPL